ncbi:MAG: Trm112 family protein [Planctomycetaceae bacterium]
MSDFELGDLADLVVCPQCRSRLVLSAESLVCTGSECRLSFPVREGIPLLLVEEADELDPSDWEKVTGRPVGIDRDSVMDSTGDDA